MNAVMFQKFPNKYFSAGIFFRENNGVSEVFSVQDELHAELKFPGGSSKDDRDKDEVDTLERELKEELKISIRVATGVHSDNRGLGHVKHFFLVTKYDGEIKSGVFWDDKEQKMGRWVSLAEFGKHSFHHREAFRHALKAEAERSPAFRAKNKEFIQHFQ